jgi:cephalosporin hydroxylase
MVANRTLRPIVEAPCSRVEQYVRLALLSPFAPSQILGEICGLLQLLAERSPKDLLEIGTSEGGTLYLLTRVADPAASLVSIDLHLPDPELLASFARRRQRITPIEGDSTAPATRQRAGEQFPSGVDFLFIDGDHSYEGVKKDFELYSPLVRPGGLIAFHDIVDDNETRYGVITGGWAGGVPRFWREVKPQFQHVEFVRDYEQDGYGIGVLFTPR